MISPILQIREFETQGLIRLSKVIQQIPEPAYQSKKKKLNHSFCPIFSG